MEYTVLGHDGLIDTWMVYVFAQCHEKMTAVMKTEEGMGIEYDEDVVCDVCRSVSIFSMLSSFEFDCGVIVFFSLIVNISVSAH